MPNPLWHGSEMIKNPNKKFLKKCEKNSKKFFYIKKKYYICGEKQNEQLTRTLSKN